MPLIRDSHDSLPYIDRPLSPASLAAANALVSSALTSTPTSPPYPSLPPAYEPKLTDLAAAEQERIERKEPLTAISTSHYEPPSPTTTPTLTLLTAASTSSAYLASRQQQLTLLDQFGKNAWLVGNAQLEDILRDYEKELVETREAVTEVNRERKGAQEGRMGEVEGLERGWREGVRGCLEVEVGVRGVEEGVREALRGR